MNQESAAEGGCALLVDATDVLDGFYTLADTAFVEGSLVPQGGHKQLEPAMHHVPVLPGMYLHNFHGISEHLIDAQGCRVVTSSENQANVLSLFIQQKEIKCEVGEAAYNVWVSIEGASHWNSREIFELIYQSTD
ncbi:MAG: hypothetical protein MUO68_01160 [Desulfobacteraceae bacterium]|nr:hypothetical protein [Desulfobacteraceae bacterium]